MNTLDAQLSSIIRQQTNVLLVEDSMPDARYVQEMLSIAFYKLVHAKSLGEAQVKASAHSFDVILLDLSLPDGHGIDTVHTMLELAPNVPIVVLTGLDDDDTAAKALKVGAQDYLQKHNLAENILTRTIRYAIERNQARETIRLGVQKVIASEAYLNLALKASHIGVWSWDIVADKVKLDELSHQIFGLGAEIVDMKDLLNCVHEEDRSLVQLAIEDAIDKKEDYDVTFRVSWSDESEHYIASSGRGIYDEGAAIRLAGIFKDITKQIVQQQNAHRLQILEQHEDFIATLTHDLKNPLIGADQLLDLICNGAMGSFEEKQLHVLRLLQQSNKDMLGLIKNLLEVYRYDAGADPLKLQSVDARDLINDCMASISAVADLSKVGLTASFDDGDHLVLADQMSLQRVVRNLLSNAIKFSAEGSTVIVSAGRVGSMYVFKVQDSGTGVHPDELPKLFQRYAQGKQGQRILSGTGLGLYLCRRLVDAHGGEITCSSVEGQGTTFVVSLPIQNQ